MKLNVVQTIIAIAISGLISYGLYSFHDSENKIVLSLGSFVFLATTLVIAIGVNFEQAFIVDSNSRQFKSLVFIRRANHNTFKLCILLNQLVKFLLC